VYDPTIPIKLVVKLLVLTRKELSAILNVARDKIMKIEMPVKKNPYKYREKFKIFAFNISGIKLLCIYIKYKRQNEKENI
tara:strand:+ start:211 stop:450 length:240 start_codon:yes stop_codon:yes gene_type:complete